MVAWGIFGFTNVPAGLVGVKAISAGFDHNLCISSGLMTPVIFIQPTNQYAPAGGAATFSAEGEAPDIEGVLYQWQFDGTNISGATNAELTLTNTQATDNGSYQVIISSDVGSITSSVAIFALVVAPEIASTAPPAPGPIWINHREALSVVVNAVGQSEYPLTYSWQLNGTNLSDSSALYAITNLPSTNDGNYTATITNIAGSTNITWDIRLALPGMVEAWGSDTNGECDRPAAWTNIAAIAAGDYHSVAVTDSGTILQWGKYFDGTNFSAVGSSPSYSNIVAVAASLGHNVALRSDGSLTNWGVIGDIGNSVPMNLSNVTAIAAGWHHNVALSNGTVVAWGDNSHNQTMVPSDLTNVIAIAAGEFHSLALRANGTVEAWGENDGGQTNVPSGLTNVVAIAAGGEFSLALKSDGCVIAWGTNDYMQTNVPSGMSNVMAIAAGHAHGVALKNDGSLQEWGDNSCGQATVPEQPRIGITFAGFPPSFQTNTYPPIIFKLIAAGGDHTMAAVYSPLVQYPVDPSKDLLLIYNSNSANSSNVCQYYLTHRPMVSNANVLGIGCVTNDTILPTEFTNDIEIPIQNWLAANATKRPAYVIFFQDIPARANEDASTTNSDGSVIYNEAAGTMTPSVQYQINQWCATNWHPFVTSINMNGIGGTNDCSAYINKLTNMALFGSNSPGQLFISASAGGYNNSNWYFDYAGGTAGYYTFADAAEQGVTNVDPTATVIGTTGTNSGGTANYTSTATNVAAYFTGGWDGGLGDSNMFVDGTVKFFGDIGWYIMTTIDSFNGQRVTFQAGFLTWFASNAFLGTNYSNTPVGATTTVQEPYEVIPNPEIYYGDLAGGKSFAISAWAAQISPYFQAVGDPFVRK